MSTTENRDSKNSEGHAIRFCSCCRQTKLLDDYFSKDRKGEWMKTCIGCRAKHTCYCGFWCSSKNKYKRHMETHQGANPNHQTRSPSPEERQAGASPHIDGLEELIRKIVHLEVDRILVERGLAKEYSE